MNILVVEDDPTSMKLVYIVLENEGFHVTRVTHPDDALDVVRQVKPDTILMDLALPTMDGLELTRLLKKDPATGHIPVIAITSFPDHFPEKEAIRAGCDAYILKPIDTRTLATVVREVGHANS